MIKGLEYHSIIYNIFSDVKGLNESEQVQVNCPMCQEREGLLSPDGKYNLEINTRSKVFRCWKCEEPKFSGSLKRLIRNFGSKADYELYKTYSNSYEDEEYIEEWDDFTCVKLPNEMIFFSNADLKNSEHFRAYNYVINERKLNRDLIYKYHLGFCTTGKYANRIIVPSYNINGEVNYFVGRSYDPKEKKRKYMNPDVDKNKFIFNDGFIDYDSVVYLVEGVFDMFSVPNSIPLLGKDIFDTLFMRLKERKPYIVVLLDPDAIANTIDIYYKLSNIYVGYEDRVRIVTLPTDEDVDELRISGGKGEVIKALYQARSLTTEDYFIKKLVNENNKRGRHDSYSKYFEWKSGSTKNFIRKM